MKELDFYEYQVAKVDDLIPYARNARTHSEEQVAQIAASIREFGFTNPLLIDEKNNVIAGHGRLLASRKLGLKVVPVINVTGLSDDARRALVIADNQIALNSGWDEEMLANELSSLADDYGELMGFSEEELINLLNPPTGDDGGEEEIPDDNYTEQYGVIVMCVDDLEQEHVFNKLTGEGYKVKVVAT